MSNENMVYHLTYKKKKKNKLLIHATTWMNLKPILSEGSLPQRTIYCMTPFICNTLDR